VKSEMLAILGDLDHAKERDQQLALCTKALAPSQPQRVRYIAIHTLADLHDPRARAFLLPLQNDPDREIRTAASQVLSDLAQ
jgi:HEAT repeat protein